MDKKELNKLELEFLSAIDWNIYVSPQDYEKTTQKLEYACVMKQTKSKSDMTYSEMNILSRNLELMVLWDTLYEYTLKVTAVCAFAYAASLMTMIGTCHLLSKTSLFNLSMQNLNNLSMRSDKKDIIEVLEPIPEMDKDPEDEIEAIAEKLRLNQDSWKNETNFFDVHEDKVGMKKEEKFCLQDHQINQNLMFLKEDHLMSNRLTRALFALKIGSFRDLMLGPQVMHGIGTV